MAIPKPLCECRVCREARYKGVPYERTGPSAYLQDANLLIDTPAEIVGQLNRTGIERVNRITFTHLDPDHIEGFRVVEQITLDFRSWKAYPEKQIQLVLPVRLYDRLRDIRSVYGPLVDYYETQGFVRCVPFDKQITLGDVRMTALPVSRQETTAYILVFERGDKKVVYAPCDIKPFPLEAAEVQNPDLLIIQPGIFEEGLKNLLMGEAFGSEVFHVEQERAVFRCNRCESQWGLEDRSDLAEDEREAIHFMPEAAHVYMRCPGCSGPDFRVEKGRGVLVKSIVIEENVVSDKLVDEQGVVSDEDSSE